MSESRVLLLVENLPIARDHRLRKQVDSLLRSGFAVTVVCPHDPANAKIEGITLRDYPAPAEAQSKAGYVREYGWSLVCAWWQICRSMGAEGFDAIQVASTPDIYFLISMPLRMLGKRVVFDARDLSPEIYTRRYGDRRSIAYHVLCLLERASYRSANRVLAVNASVAAIATGRGKMAPDRVKIVGNGPIIGRVAGDKVGLGSQESPICCWVGMMGPQDGVDLALQAVAELVHGPNPTEAHFVFAGTGDALPSLRVLAKELGIESWVSFPGWLNADQVEDLLRRSVIGLEPNLEDFVSPVKAMEYMAHALPVVAFDLRETRNILGPEAPLVPVGDVAGFAKCIDTLLSDPPERRRLGREGRLRVEEIFAWELQEARYVGLYRDLLSSERGKPVAQMEVV